MTGDDDPPPGRDGGPRRRQEVAACIAVGVLAAAFVALSAVVWATNRRVGLDRLAERLVPDSAADRLFAYGLRWDVRAEEVVELGDRPAVIAAAVVLCLLAVLGRDRIGAIVAFGGPGLTGFVTEYIAKPIINVPVAVGSRAFPSGHAGGATAVALVVVVLVWRRWGWRPVLAVAPLAATFALLVAGSLLRLEFHYPTDVLGGALLAALIVLGMTACLSLYRGPGSPLLRPGSQRPLAAGEAPPGPGRTPEYGSVPD